MKVKLLSHVRLFAIPWTVVYQASLSMGFSRQEYWNGLPLPSPGDLPDPGIEPSSLMSPALAGRFFTISTTWEGQRTSAIHMDSHASLGRGFLGGSEVKNSLANAGDMGLILGSGRSPREGNGNPFQYSFL